MSTGTYITKTGAEYDRVDYKVGSRIWGHFRSYKNGAVVYVHRITVDDLFRDQLSTSDALRNGVAAWPIDETTLFMLKARGVKNIAFAVENPVKRSQIDAYFVTRTSEYLTIGVDKRWKMHNYRKRSGAFQRWLPLAHFAVRTSSLVMPLGA